MPLEIVQPEGWRSPRGYSNGVIAPAGSRTLAIAGQIAWDANQKLVPGDFAAQFRQALANVVAVVRAAGGSPGDLLSLSIYVVDKGEYVTAARELGRIWRELIGDHYPAMALVEVAGLLEAGARVEIQGLAAIR